MIAFHGDDKIKAEYIARVRAHREADQLVQGYGYWQGGRGCAVGCTMHTDSEPHEAYETTLGIPARLAYLEDCIFESLPVDQSRLWPEKFLGAIPVGKDLSRVWHQFSAWLLSESGLLTITHANRDAINLVASLHGRAATGESVASGGAVGGVGVGVGGGVGGVGENGRKVARSAGGVALANS